VNPKNLKYHREHDWVRIDGDTAVFGLTDYVVAGSSYAEVESVKAVSDVYAPLSGSVLEVNDEVVDAPELINESPYEEGWLIKVRLSDPSEADDLMTADEYNELLASEE
jgi:glycine cleavage system H protein